MILQHQHFNLFQKAILHRFVFRPPFRVPYSMVNEACLIFTVNAKGKVYGATEIKEVDRNEGVLIRCGHYINKWSNLKNSEISEVIIVRFCPNILKQIYQEEVPSFFKEKPKKSRIAIQKIKVEKMIQSYLKSLLFYFENPSLVNDELLILKMKELILLLINTDNTNTIQNILRDLFSPEQFSLKQIVDTHLYQDLSMDDLAALSNVSTPTFKRKFKQLFGESPGRYIKQKRMEKAAELLQISTDNITEIGYACGFQDSGYFAKVFKSHFGCSPKAFRANTHSFPHKLSTK